LASQSYDNNAVLELPLHLPACLTKTCGLSSSPARQIGFDHASECPHLCTLAYDYLRKNKGYEDNIFAFFHNTADPGSLIVSFIEELDKCILGYFSFHWKCSTYMITQVLTVEGAPKRKLRNMVLEATRSQRFERVTRNLKVTRLFSTLVEELKAIGLSPQGPAQCSDVMVPVAHCDRSPVLLLMGGGMGAGKSTVLKDILKESFWSGAAANAVVVEADAFKETDVIYRAISSRGHHNDMLQTAELVHQSSMDAASSLLVTALNEGRDVIMDGTLSWEPFFQQTVAMARAVHRQRYRMGVGYKVTEDGSITEDYWEPVEARSTDEESEMRLRKPYRIELVGVVCDAYLAVVRGIRRAVITGRAVRVKSQLQSHKRFATAFRGYCGVVDNARLYSTNSMGAPKLIGWKDGESNLLVDPEEIGCLERVSGLNDEANCVDELYPDGQPSPSAWQDLVASPSRASVQRELRAAVQASEARFRAASLADGALRGDAPVQTF
uniref:Zeta toxin domain-containing protein n=1 Tax=Aegilops tauschii subsp. strangulata TaxID=200361 RepID=A0A452ZHS4_AEGTS